MHFFVNAQQKELIKTLTHKVQNETNEKEKLILLDSLSKEIYNTLGTDFEFYKKEYPKYCFEYIKLAKKQGDYDSASKKTSRLANHYLQVIGKPDSALVILNTMLRDSNNIRKQFNLGQLYLKRAGAYYQIDNLKIAVEDYEIARKVFFRTRDTIYEADATYFSGQATERLGNLTESLLKYQQAQKLYEKMQDTAYVAYTGLESLCCRILCQKSSN